MEDDETIEIREDAIQAALDALEQHGVDASDGEAVLEHLTVMLGYLLKGLVEEGEPLENVREVMDWVSETVLAIATGEAEMEEEGDEDGEEE